MDRFQQGFKGQCRFQEMRLAMPVDLIPVTFVDELPDPSTIMFKEAIARFEGIEFNREPTRRVWRIQRPDTHSLWVMTTYVSLHPTMKRHSSALGDFTYEWKPGWKGEICDCVENRNGVCYWYGPIRYLGEWFDYESEVLTASLTSEGHRNENADQMRRDYVMRRPLNLGLLAS